MKIAVIGATGTVGRAVFAELTKRHETLEIGATRGAHRVDLKDRDSIRRLFDSIGQVDAIVAAAGHVHFGELVKMTPEQFRIGLDDKLMGQVNLVLGARDYLNDGGSFTLTSGIVGAEVIRLGAAAAAVNGAIEGFVRGAAIGLPRGLRINAVSPTMLEEASESFGPYFRGFEAAPGARVALAYSRSVEGAETGRVYKVH
ncbi:MULTISPECIES: short chain dehydrogenase [unclassified Caballeronia]|uniref:short chain dehydrogenase n=1 Tax=unclassified Caballeronia TaxID=2646786 RepID=UPI0028674B8A|nr:MULTISPECIES: short chain dehydrogenase [unclassified Caballeronia]MDR5754748.1 short chain dehydrogenase [Caballeronia sp. LZ024]MDR5839750.1 short chain dehydrogenase [Caballeronia sp. LZ031]